jgi:hypothetical protein
MIEKLNCALLPAAALSLAAAFTLLGAAVAPSDASAAACLTWQVSSADEHYIGFGEELDAFGVGTGRVAICDYNADTGGFQYITSAGACTTSSPGTDVVAIFGSGGIDHIFPFTSSHDCSGTPGTNTIGPFSSSFAVGLYAVGSGSGDELHGTINDDFLFSNSDSSYTADTSLDRMCGMPGDDTLIGDGDDGAGSPYECEDGGTHNDTCDAGDPFATGDRAANCETIIGQFSGTAAACSCSTVDLWPF